MGNGTKAKIRQRRATRRSPGPAQGITHDQPRMGIRNRDAAALTGFTRPALSQAVKAGAFGQYPDKSYVTPEFEAYIRDKGDSHFSVPEDMRGTEHSLLQTEQAYPSPLAEAELVPNLEQEILHIRLQREKAALERDLVNLDYQRGMLIDRDVASRTVRDAVIHIRQGLERMGVQLADDLAGLDELSIKRRLDEYGADLARQIQTSLRELAAWR